MKVIYNNLIPFKGYIAINLFGILFVREDLKEHMDDVAFNHESIHTAQMKELGYLIFYVLYLIEWFLKFFVYFSFSKAYLNISFEREAYHHEYNLKYLNDRKHYCWIHRILK